MSKLHVVKSKRKAGKRCTKNAPTKVKEQVLV
jgi:hypothetical protein